MASWAGPAVNGSGSIGLLTSSESAFELPIHIHRPQRRKHRSRLTTAAVAKLSPRE